MTFYDIILTTDWDKIEKEIANKTSSDVEAAFNKEKPDLEDLMFKMGDTKTSWYYLPQNYSKIITRDSSTGAQLKTNSE